MPAPFDGELFTFYNPDGSEVRVRGWGNQFAAVFETLDGYTVVQDPQSGFYHYATLSEDRQELVPSDVRVGGPAVARSDLPQHLRAPRATMRAEARAAREATGVQPRWQIRREQRQAQRRADSRNSRGEARTDEEPEPAGTTGNYVGLVILVEFPDVPGTITQAQVNDFCNTPGHSGFGNNGSAYDYFLAVSDGKLRYTNQVTAYYTAQHPRAHYTDPAIPFGTRARELIIEALNHLKASGYDFSGLSSDSGGFVYALNVFYAGPRVNNWSQGLWPHAWSLASPYAASSTQEVLRLPDHRHGRPADAGHVLPRERSHGLRFPRPVRLRRRERRRRQLLPDVLRGLRDESGARRCLPQERGRLDVEAHHPHTGHDRHHRSRHQRLPDPPEERDRVLHPREPAAGRSRRLRCRMPDWPSGTSTRTGTTATNR